MRDVRIYSVSDRYIAYLRADDRLTIVFDNKLGVRTHTRKYLGIVFTHDEFNYFIPFSSPKKSDYITAENGEMVIRKNVIPIIRMTSQDSKTGRTELKGTLKLSNMIPVPLSELTPYDISQETDSNYCAVIQKEWDFIKANLSLIIKNAQVLYNQKTKCDALYAGKKMPAYLKSTVDFQYAEKKCREFQKR